MVAWEYIWRDTHLREVECTTDRIQRVRYGHFWKPGLENEAGFPDQAGIDSSGANRWELIAITTSPMTLVTEIGPAVQRPLHELSTHRLFFKRPNQE